MIKSLLSLLLFVSLFIPTYSQENEVDLNERLTVYFPILQPPNCVKYLTDFGVTQKVATDYVQSVGVDFFATVSIPNLEGVTASIYSDPENIISPDGDQLTEHILYSLIFTEGGKYFAFSMNIEFTSQELADSFNRTLLTNLKVKKYSRNYSGIIKCKETGKQRMITSKVNGNTLTYVVMDYQTIIDMSVDTSKM